MWFVGVVPCCFFGVVDVVISTWSVVPVAAVVGGPTGAEVVVVAAAVVVVMVVVAAVVDAVVVAAAGNFVVVVARMLRALRCATFIKQAPSTVLRIAIPKSPLRG